jgi:hypothetical protein
MGNLGIAFVIRGVECADLKGILGSAIVFTFELSSKIVGIGFIV